MARLPMRPPKQRTTLVLLAAILALGAALRLSFVRGSLFYPDSTIYLSLAKNMTRGDFLPLALCQDALTRPSTRCRRRPFLLGMRLETAGVAVSLLSGLGLIVVLFLLGRRLGGTPTGLAAALLGAAVLQLVRYSTEILTEMLFLLLYYLLMLVVLRAPTSRPAWSSLVCGLLAALAFAARFVGISALPMALVWVFVLRLAGGSRISAPGSRSGRDGRRPPGSRRAAGRRAYGRRLPAALLAALLVAGGLRRRDLAATAAHPAGPGGVGP